jgi:hypothetical protein
MRMLSATPGEKKILDKALAMWYFSGDKTPFHL